MHSESRFRGFNEHPRLEGSHAFLSPSSYHWVNYTTEKLQERLKTAEAAARGTSLHELAAHAISERVYLREDEFNPSLASYVNDAIDFNMTPEQTLFYSFHCYGTADAIAFEEALMFLRIHDFKSGVSATSFKQLYVYAGIFCLEYGFLPYEINGEFRIYQFDGYRSIEIDVAELAHNYDMIRMHSQAVDDFRSRVPRGRGWK